MTQPLTSQTQQPGYSINQKPNGSTYTNAEWRATLAEWMASMWAYGGESRQKVLDMMSPVWYSAKYGEPEPTDQEGTWSPRTILAFSRFAEDYKGGSPGIDQVMPYIPPGPNDYVETPEQTATRIAQDNFERTLKQQMDLSNKQTTESGRQFDVTAAQNAYRDALDAFNTQYQNELSRYSIESNNFNTAEGERGANLRQAGSLSSAFQQLLDSRTNKAIELQANPGDFIQRESQVRAMNAPQGTETPAFKDDETLKKIIDALINYKPGTAPVAPVQGTPPTPNTTGAQTFQMNPGTETNEGPYARLIQEQGQKPMYANGTENAAGEFIAGDPQVGNVANPEVVAVHNPGPDTRVSVTPLQQAAMKRRKKFAFGADAFDPSTLKLKSYPDEAYQNYPTLKYFQGGIGKTQYDTLNTGTATGAFGARLPESGAINYGRFLNIAKDPVSLAMLQSSYKSGSRDLLAEVARAKARAPFGQAVQTSLIRS